METLYAEFERLTSNTAKKDFILNLSATVRYEFLAYVMRQTGLLLSDIMNSLGIWRLE